MNQSIILVRKPSQALAQCELTHIQREQIDFPKLLAQHSEYVDALKQFGCKVHYLPELNENPDGVFVEDTALVLTEAVILTRPGAQSRLGEVHSVKAAMSTFRNVVYEIMEPGTVDGGDILKIGKELYVGLSSRTNQAGISQMQALLKPFGYSVTAIPVSQCLHLKTGVSYLGKNHLLINSRWVDTKIFPTMSKIEVSPQEPFGANVLVIGKKILMAASAVETADKLKKSGFEVMTVDISELAKAEAGLTCLSLIFRE